MSAQTLPEVVEGVPDFAECMRRIGLDAYREQVEVSRYLEIARDTKKVGFIEAPTATGKTFVIAHHALEHAASTRECYVVAVPTIELGHQTLNAVQTIQKASDAFKPLRATIILGRQEFVSPYGLEDLIDAFRTESKADTANAIRGWLDQGAPGRSDSHPSYTLDGLERWLDAKQIKDRVSGAVTLGPADKESEAAKAYQRQFTQNADIFIVTHAMLSRDLVARFIATSRERRKKGMQTTLGLSAPERWLEANQQRLEVETGDEGKLPDYRRLIIDEAHLFRDNFESATRTGISISSLVRHVEQINKSLPKVASAATLKQIRQVRKSLTNQPSAQAGNRIQIDWSEQDSFTSAIEKIYGALERIKTSKIPDHLEHDKLAVEQARYALREAINARSAVSTIFEWSPVAAFPTITIGRRNVSQQLMLLWTRLHSAALVSATLFTENVGAPSIQYMAARLAVPADRKGIEKQIKADWLIAPVTVLMPDTAHGALLREDEPGKRDAWLDAVAEQLVLLSDKAKGTLVLNTRRSDSHDLSERLRRLVSSSRIIDGSTGRASALKQVFIQMARDGVSPIWLAQGPAWTGLDLPDDVLDALAITCMPFPLPDAANVSGDKIGFYGAPARKNAQMAMTFKQGLGRLVRSRNAGPKTFAMLDPRVLTHPNARGVKNLLASYAQKNLPASKKRTKKTGG